MKPSFHKYIAAFSISQVLSGIDHWVFVKVVFCNLSHCGRTCNTELLGQRQWYLTCMFIWWLASSMAVFVCLAGWLSGRPGLSFMSGSMFKIIYDTKVS